MTKAVAPTLEQLAARLDEQAAEIAALRLVIDMQYVRVRDRHSELNRETYLLRDRQLLDALAEPPAAAHDSRLRRRRTDIVSLRASPESGETD